MINKLTLLLMCLCISTNVQPQVFNSASTSILSAIPDPLSFEGMTCQELYTAASTLEPQSQHFRSALLNEQSDQLVSVLGTVARQIHYYYVFYIPYYFYEQHRVQSTGLILDMVRQRMAYLRCFEKS